jgi:large subunit ribosomal protein L29
VPILRVREIRGMSVEERDKKLSEIRAELARLRTMVRAGGAVENPARIRELRKGLEKRKKNPRRKKVRRRRNQSESNPRYYTSRVHRN